MHVTCPDCNAVNRLPRPRLAEAPRCGRCGEDLFTGQPVALADDNFAAQVLRSDLPVVVDFWAAWCGPCRTLGPIVEQAALALEPAVRFAKLDTERSPELAARHAIRGIPTLIMFRSGREIARRSGAMPLTELLAWVRRLAALPAGTAA